MDDVERDILKSKRYISWLRIVKNIKYCFSRLFSKRYKGVTKLKIRTDYGYIKVICFGLENLGVLKPVFFDLHGGGFVFGHASNDNYNNIKISKELDCRVISIDYEKAPQNPFPIGLYQAYSVIKYFVESSYEYGIDISKIGVGGYSAGGNLATSISMISKNLNDFSIKCQIMCYPPLDLEQDPYSKPQMEGSDLPKLAKIFTDCYVKPDNRKNPLASPLYADQDTLTGVAPALIILAAKDSLCKEGEIYGDMLKEVGVKVDTIIYKNESHGFLEYKNSDSREDAIEKMVVFLQNYLFND